MIISREVFDQQRRPRYGKSNPERMQLAFWDWMIAGDQQSKNQDEGPLRDIGLLMREGKLKSSMGPYRARDLFNVPPEDGPIWTFDRMGATCSQVGDGRVIWIGGEHEDFYDPDFCIYNDVVVFDGKEFQIYGYPKEIFPPTDFHSATSTSDRIVIVGGLRYQDTRRSGETPVYLLDTSNYKMEQLPTSGQKPGWLYKHDAKFDSPSSITIGGGEVYEEFNGRKRYRRNFEEYTLNINTGEWKQLTYRNWLQFFIRQANDRPLALDKRPDPRALIPHKFNPDLAVSEDWDRITFSVQGVPVELKVGIFQIEVVVRGDLPGKVADKIGQEVMALTENTVHGRCILEGIK
jgi:hypothetical protein